MEHGMSHISFGSSQVFPIFSALIQMPGSGWQWGDFQISQEQGFGVETGIPTMVVAAAPLDDVLSIAGWKMWVLWSFHQGKYRGNRGVLIREKMVVSMLCVNFHAFFKKPTGFWGTKFCVQGQEAESHAGVRSKIGTAACTILWTSKTALTALLHSKKLCVPPVVGTELDSAITHDLLERFIPLFLLTQTR